jgi:hypothetical protein
VRDAIQAGPAAAVSDRGSLNTAGFNWESHKRHPWYTHLEHKIPDLQVGLDAGPASSCIPSSSYSVHAALSVDAPVQAISQGHESHSLPFLPGWCIPQWPCGSCCTAVAAMECRVRPACCQCNDHHCLFLLCRCCLQAAGVTHLWLPPPSQSVSPEVRADAVCPSSLHIECPPKMQACKGSSS